MTPTFSQRNATTLSAILLTAAIPAFWAGKVGRGMLALLSEVDPEHAYFRLIEPILQYVLMPIVLLSALILVMAPGLLWVAASGRAGKLHRWLIESFVVSLLIIAASTAILQLLTGQPLVGRQFAAVVWVLSAACAGRFIARSKGHTLPRIDLTGPTRREITGVLVIPIFFAVVLTPKFFWEAFNGDGAHAFESTRLLLYQVWPFWSEEAGAIGTWPSVNGLTLAYPLSWFMRLFGMTEAGVRLPFVLFLPLLYAALRSVILAGRSAVAGGAESALVGAGVIGYALVMSYSATYNPYSADISMPATQDTLVLIFFLGAVGAWARQEPRWTLAWTLLALLTSPAAFPMLAALVVGILVSTRPWRWRKAAMHGAYLAGCVVGLLVFPVILSMFGVPTPGKEHGVGLLTKFAFLALGDGERFLFAFLPVGIFPVIGMLAWRGADELTRILTVVSGLVFGMYYLMGASSLHYFVPAMVLPVAVFWRRFPANSLARPTLLLCGIASVLAIWLAAPAGSGIYVASRDVGARIDARAFAGYHQMDHAAVAASETLEFLFPTDAEPEVPAELYGDSPLAWHYYAQRPEYRNGPKDYVMAETGAPPAAEGAVFVGGDDRVAIYVLDRARWQDDRTQHPTTSRGRAVYQIDRDVLFMRGAARDRFGFFSPGIWVADLLGIQY